MALIHELDLSLGLTLNGSDVQLIEDQVGAGDVEQLTAINQPPYLSDGYLGHPAVDYSVLGEHLEGTSTTAWNPSPDGVADKATYVFVVNMQATGVGNKICYKGTDIGDGNRKRFEVYKGGADTITVVYASGAARRVWTSGALDFSKPLIIITTWDSDTEIATLDINGQNEEVTASDIGGNVAAINDTSTGILLARDDAATQCQLFYAAMYDTHENVTTLFNTVSAKFWSQAPAASFLSSLTSQWPFNEASGAILDSIGSKDSAVPEGTPTYNGESVTYDGVDQAHSWGSTVNPMDHAGDVTHYLKWRMIPDPDGAAVTPIDGSESPTAFQQVAGWDDFNKVNHFRPSFGSNTIDIPAGRVLTNTEIITSMISYNRTTKIFSYVIKSDHPTTPFDLSGSFGIGTSPAVQSLHLGKNKAGTVFGNIEVYEMGADNGTAHSIADMQATVDQIVTPPDGAVLVRDLPTTLSNPF